jgi:hypothetical protein
MRSPFHFIVKPLGGKRYDNIRRYGDKELIISSSQEDHTVSNRLAKVMSPPLHYDGDIKKGDILLVHHNVFKKYYDMKGEEQSGPSLFKDDLYLIDHDQFFLYNRGDGWEAPGDCCFVSPVKSDDDTLFNHNSEDHNLKPLEGVVVYGNKTLSSMGVEEGDVVSFQPESEYKFIIDDQTLYRMYNRNICVKI